MDTLPNDIFARILSVLDRYSLAGLVLTCKTILSRSNNEELLQIIASVTDAKVPKSKLLVVYDYSLINPSEYIPVYFRRNYFGVLLDDRLEENLSQYTDSTRFQLTFEISTLGISEFLTVYMKKSDFGFLYLYSPDHNEEQNIIDAFVGVRRYEINTHDRIQDIISEIYWQIPHHIVKIVMTDQRK